MISSSYLVSGVNGLVACESASS